MRAAPPSETVLVARLRRESALIDAEGLARLVREGTWLAFRSLPAKLRKRRIELQLGAQTVNIEALRYSPIAAAETREAQVSVVAADPATTITVRTLAETGDVRRIYLPAARVAEALGIAPETYYGFRISLPVEVEILARDAHNADALATLESCAAELRAARDYCRRSIDEGIDGTLRLLEARRRRSRNRDIVTLVDAGRSRRVVGSVPTNEHEVLILAGKLEWYVGRVLPLFRIWEHTSQIGIDALVDIQLSRDSAQVRSGTLEFEFELRNFLSARSPDSADRFCSMLVHQGRCERDAPVWGWGCRPARRPYVRDAWRRLDTDSRFRGPPNTGAYSGSAARAAHRPPGDADGTPWRTWFGGVAWTNKRGGRRIGKSTRSISSWHRKHRERP